MAHPYSLRCQWLPEQAAQTQFQVYNPLSIWGSPWGGDSPVRCHTASGCPHHQSHLDAVETAAGLGQASSEAARGTGLSPRQDHHAARLGHTRGGPLHQPPDESTAPVPHGTTLSPRTPWKGPPQGESGSPSAPKQLPLTVLRVASLGWTWDAARPYKTGRALGAQVAELLACSGL